MRINQERAVLGNHYHNYDEVFFTPTGGFALTLADIDADIDDTERVQKFTLIEGSRIFIPSYVAHRVVAEKGSVLIGFGSMEFSPKRFFQCSETLAKRLEE